MLHLKQSQFTCSACGSFTKDKNRIKKFMQTGDAHYIYKNELEKACFGHDTAYSDSKDLTKRTKSDKVLKDNAFEIANNPKYDRYQRVLASIVYKFFDKKSKGSGVKNETKQNQQLANEVHKPIIRKFKKRRVHSSFTDNIWGTDLADMQLIIKFNKGFRFLLSVIDIFSKYAWVVPVKDKKGASIVNAFRKILKQSTRKPSKIWVDKDSEFYNNSFKKWLQDNDIAMYSTHNEEKSVVGNVFIKKKIHGFNVKKCVY